MKRPLNIVSIAKVMGHLMVIESVLLLIPLAVSLCYGEEQWHGFAIASLSAFIVGSVVSASTRRIRTDIRGREGFVLTASVWVVFGLFGMIPFMTAPSPLGFTDAMFEVISGFTTTGASVIRDVEAEPRGLLFWRAFTQWIGGLGIILFMLALLPELNRSAGISMFNAEASGITHDKLHPRIRQTALSLWGIYVVITIAGILLLWAGPMDLFDSVCQTFAAIATGGFTTRNAGIEAWHSAYAMIVLIVVMFVAGLNFIVIFAACTGGIGKLLHNEVARGFAGVAAAAYLLLVASLWIRGVPPTADNYIVEPLFHVISAVTSTGFSVSAAESWGPFALMLTILLMLCGSCAGSTSGGIKVDRMIVIWRNLVNEIKKTVFPKRVYVVSLNGSFLQSSLTSRVSAFVTLYLLIVLASAAVITLYGYPLTDSIFMVASCIGCNGLGYGVTGVEGSYASLPDAVKWLLMLDMLIGRLELFTFIVLLLPDFWRR